ncbi:MAG: DEAD/DEAH box helicase family protein [Syntrophales bacterium]|nr:DEAD/DEAH box helicase family protein [Syntrophales bacterium]
MKANPMLMAVRAAVIIADSAGSAIVREGIGLEEWMNDVFGKTWGGRLVRETVIKPRIREIENLSGRTFYWSQFQDAAEQLPSRTLLLAPCGSGKTLAAWRWIEGPLNNKPASRVLFLYPTRATATEEFKDYVPWAPEADAALLHGTAAFDLDGVSQDLEDERAGKNFSLQERLFALACWPRSIFTATVDQFLGFMCHGYRSICLLPLLADSVVVIDEVHSFDKRLFSVLKGFLKHFSVPVLCITASLSPVRISELME